jgi:hypothetical protein
MISINIYCWGSIISIVTGYGLDNQGVRIRVKNFLFHVVQIGSEDHPASSPMSTGELFARGKAAGA